MVTIVILIIQAQPTVYLKTQEGVCLKVHVYTHLNCTLCRSAFQLYPLHLYLAFLIVL